MAVRRNRTYLRPVSDVQASQPLTTVEIQTDTNDPVVSHSVPDAPTQSAAAAIPTDVNTNPDPAPVKWQRSRQTKTEAKYEQYELY
ncbi:hypothetical protein EB796_008079 [Bugula neritina]|uniref:Uncharacterized protein n=1 Tax=Bugula neritina TaxID=10212 RepID=A0A7J7K6Q5_BUGNE|nr:hypothetical protein EB796_008079 [Bugula neritina]